MMGRYLLLTLALAGMVRAQVAEASLSMGVSSFRSPGVGVLSTGVNLNLNSGFRFAARLTLNTKKYFGHEIGYAYSRSRLRELNSGLPIHQGFYNFLAYATGEGTRIRPFAAGGGHFSSFYPPGTSAYSGTGYTKFGVNYGAGVKFKINEIFALRFDARDYVTAKPFGLPGAAGALQQIEYSAGVGVLF